MSTTKRGGSYSLLIFGILLLLAVGSWVGFDVYRGLTKTTVTKVLQAQIAPLRISIDAALVAGLRSRRSFSELELLSVVSVPLEELEVSVSALALEEGSEEATGEAELVGEEATASGQILLK